MAERHGLKQLTFLARLATWADVVQEQAEAMARTFQEDRKGR
jgi:hypothetical protein